MTGTTMMTIWLFCITAICGGLGIHLMTLSVRAFQREWMRQDACKSFEDGRR